ncbi:MAG TPA: RDD family protein [Polyangia bacterium]|nr:RDD family protein [Polyangia bacterium]
MDGQQLASRGERLAAYWIECLLALPFGLVGGVLGYKLGRAAGAHEPLEPSLIFALGLTALCMIALMIIQMYWLAAHGQTLGKRWMKIRIVRLDGSKAGFVGTVLLRGLLNLGVYLALLLLFPPLGYVYALVDVLFIFGPQNRCLHDMIAGTKVVRVTDPDPALVVTPPAS